MPQILKQQSLECVRSSGHARYHKCQEVRVLFCSMGCMRACMVLRAL